MNSRQISFINLLLTSGDELLPMSFYAGKLGVSDKTLRRDLGPVETFLAAAQARIEKKSGVGIRLLLDQDMRGQLKNRINYLSDQGQKPEQQPWEKHSRQLDIALNLLLYSDEYTSLSALAYKYYVSKSTINYDLLHLADMLEHFSLKLRRTPGGTIISGREGDIRQALTDVIGRILYGSKDGGRAGRPEILAPSMILDIFREDDISFVNNFISWVEEHYRVKFGDRDFDQLALHLLVMIYRMKNGCYLDQGRTTGSTFREQSGDIKTLTDEACTRIREHYRIELTHFERESVGGAFRVTHRFGRAADEVCEEDIFHLFCEDFIDAFATITNINLRENPDFCENVIAHIHLMLNRLSHGTPASNPLMELLLKDYRSTLNVCNIICRILVEKFHLPELSIDEISFLMLYILGEIVRQSEHARVMFVTDLSKSVANLMLLRLQQRYPQWQFRPASAEDYRLAARSDYDFCISTVILDVTEDPVPYVYVSPILEERDDQNIRELFWRVDESLAIYRLELIRMVHDLRDIGCTVDFLPARPATSGESLITVVALKEIRYRYYLNAQNENRCVFITDGGSVRILEVYIDMCSFDFMLFSSRIVYLLDNCPAAVLPEFIEYFREGEANV